MTQQWKTKVHYITSNRDKRENLITNTHQNKIRRGFFRFDRKWEIEDREKMIERNKEIRRQKSESKEYYCLGNIQ